MNDEVETIALGFQLGASALLLVASVLIHGLGLMGISRALGLRDERLEETEFGTGALGIMTMVALALFALHAIEIALFAGFYLLIGAFEKVEEALFFSTSVYATLGYTDEFFPPNWRLVGAIQGVIGFLMLGWSTAFLVQKMTKLRR
ncbi:MAG: ion channel [Allosphingosinicella sp.]|uniref:ion channel n=1 Tax=Allosphingosinicella sp. TaxID=2823234 RepID=UPI003953E74D